MNSHLDRVRGWIKYNQFDPLEVASVGEIIYYIKEMFKEAERRRTQYRLPFHDNGMIGGYRVRSISPHPPYRDEFVIESEINYHFIQEGFISSPRSHLTIFQDQNHKVMGLYLPLLDPSLLD